MCLPAAQAYAYDGKDMVLPRTTKLEVGESTVLKVPFWNFKVVWESSNANVATVSDNGEVKGVTPGSTVITATSKTLWNIFTASTTKNEFYVTITDRTTPEPDVTELAVGESATLSFSGRTGKTTWETSDSSIVSVNAEGVITGIVEGNATITATTKSYLHSFWIFKWGERKYTTNFEVVVKNPESVPENYTVTFDSNGGSAVESQIVVEGEKAVMPTPPVREGHIFIGWYKDASFVEVYNFDEVVTEDMVLHAKWLSDADGDNLPDDFEELIDTDKNAVDTDGDGISDYDEIYLTGTDPIYVDSNDDGINDGESDEDDDGLSNLQEIKIGSDPRNADSDDDALADYEEVKVYFTKSNNNDTDSDGLNDGDEVALGLDPLNAYTDGKTLDSNRIINQNLSSDKIDPLLQEDNVVIPSISGDIKGNINNYVEVEAIQIDSLSDNRAVVGKQIKVNNDSEETIRLSFNCENDTNSEFYMICKYNDGEIIPCETKRDSNVISTNVKNGEFFVIDAEQLLIDLGIPIEEYKNINSARKSISALNKSSIKPIGQADIVFAIDTTGSMGDEINNVVLNIETFVDQLREKYSVRANFALIDYKDITEGEATNIIENKSGVWYSNVSEFKKAVANLRVNGGGDTPETAIDALATATNLDFRQNANKFIVLITDANYKNNNTFGIKNMEEMISVLNDAEIVTSVISSSNYEKTYSNLYTETNGVFGNIYGNFSETLLKLADNIGEIVNDGSWVVLDDFQLIKLDKPVGEDISCDSDGDSCSDVDELGKKQEKDLLPYLKWVFLNYGVPLEMYTGPKTVSVYKYNSNPILEDTDYDGICDDDDVKPRSNVFAGKMNGHEDYDIKNAEYSFDYRIFFDNSKYYSDSLGSASLIFSNTIYGNGFDYSDGSKANNIKELMQKHGFDKVIDYELDKNCAELSINAYNDDDISHVAIGFKDVEYKNKKKTIVAVIIQGTDNTVKEWSSNFDMGDTTKGWNSTYHKGFYNTEQRIKLFVKKYVDKYLDGKNIAYWVSGHSRGAALANILAAELIDEGNEVFAYTFATPSTTISSNFNDYKYSSIFNFVNTSDVVTYLPSKKWKFNRFGITRTYSLDTKEEINEWKNQTGQKEYKPYDEKMINLVLNRIIKTCAWNWDMVYTRAGSQDLSIEQYQIISDRAKRYCDIEVVYKNNEISKYKLYPSLGFFFQLVAEFLGGEETTKDNILSILCEFWNSRYSPILLFLLVDAKNNVDVVKENLTLPYKAMADGHTTATYYFFV